MPPTAMWKSIQREVEEPAAAGVAAETRAVVEGEVRSSPALRVQRLPSLHTASRVAPRALDFAFRSNPTLTQHRQTLTVALCPCCGVHLNLTGGGAGTFPSFGGFFGDRRFGMIPRLLLLVQFAAVRNPWLSTRGCQSAIRLRKTVVWSATR
jgi:hypothetical protein